MSTLEQRRADAMRMSKMPVQENCVGQKFPRGARVHINQTLPKCMGHFIKDVDAIIEYSYEQKFRCGNHESYSLVLLNKDGKALNTVAWYDDANLTLVSDDIEEGLKIIEGYRKETKCY